MTMEEGSRVWEIENKGLEKREDILLCMFGYDVGISLS